LHETASLASPIEGTQADPAPRDFRERLRDGCIHATLKSRPLPIIVEAEDWQGARELFIIYADRKPPDTLRMPTK